MELEEVVMMFGAFTNTIINEIGSAAPAACHLQQVLSEAATKKDRSQSWTAEARSGNKHNTLKLLEATHTFPVGSQFEVPFKMERLEEEIVIVQGFQPLAITIVPEVVTVLTPGTHQPATAQATPHQPANSQLANNQPLNTQPVDNQPAKDQLANNHPANLPIPDLTLEQFFTICKIDFHNRQIQALLKKNLIFHWSAFKGTLEAIGQTKANN
ncbi:hypothetical protein PCASD_17499 [Puccinia coronata f. sp. avenae]|uniref:Uncharacterized protein n=1 Tax=Puccinia coronata f. sp. avenae TaxID=200324 RepID=A0A2N5TWB2_9BASI|nr:hypothetical protein PCASD_17499 [Puccinia coronata f. sp. avenae]